jgi:hypothetical protein
MVAMPTAISVCRHLPPLRGGYPEDRGPAINPEVVPDELEVSSGDGDDREPQRPQDLESLIARPLGSLMGGHRFTLFANCRGEILVMYTRPYVS